MRRTNVLRIAALASSLGLAAVYVGYRAVGADAARQPAQPAPSRLEPPNAAFSLEDLDPRRRVADPLEHAPDVRMPSSKSALIFGERDVAPLPPRKPVPPRATAPQ